MNEISFDQCAVAFLDILGFKNFIANTEVPGSKEFAQFCELQKVIARQLEFSTDAPHEQPHRFPKDVGLEIIHISDSFILSAPINNEKRPGYSGLVAVSIKTIQLAHQLLKMGFLVRGGIAVGNVYRTPANIVGTGYQKAYETESKEAKTPRVLLHQSDVDRLESDLHSGYQLGALSIFMKEGNQVILDTLNTQRSYVGDQRVCDITKIFESYKKEIERNLASLDPGSPRDKWEWMARLFNAKQRHSNDLCGVARIDIDQYSKFAFGPVIEQPDLGPLIVPRDKK